MVEGIPLESYIPPHRTNLHHRPSQPQGIHLPKHPQHLPRQVNRAPEVRLHLAARAGVGDGLEIAHQAVAGVVDEDIDAAEFVHGGGDHGGDVGGRGHVEFELQDIGAVGEVAEGGGLAGGGGDAVAGLGDAGDEGGAEAG